MYSSAEDKIKNIAIKDYKYIKTLGYGSFGVVSLQKGKTHNVSIKLEAAGS